MKKITKHIIIALVLTLFPAILHAQDENQASIRQGKVILTDTSASIDSLSVYDFLNLEQNIIDLKGNDWRCI